MKFSLIFAFILMGFTSLVVQSLLLREFLISFYGNELTIGLILANWIILEALGSKSLAQFALKTKSGLSLYALIQTLISLYLPLSIFLIRNVKNLLGIPFGEGVGILSIVMSSFFIILPLSILDGMEFPLGCRLWSDFSKKPLESAGRVYILEALGFILAGPVFTFIFITRLDSFQIAFCIGIINLFSAGLLLKQACPHLFKKVVFSLVLPLFLGNIFFLFSGAGEKLHLYSIKKQWQNQNLIDYRNSIYANLAIVRQHEQYTVFSDAVPIITTPIPDIVCIEELVHFAMLVSPQPKTVLVLGGGLGGLLKEVLKYPVEKVEYAELDPVLIEMVKKLPTQLTQRELNDPRLEIKLMDGRRFIRLTKNQYDVIILNLPIPTSLQLNRFYTQEFFQLAKDHLKENGIFILGLSGSLSYLSPELRNLNGSILNTLKKVFAYVNIIPGEINLYLATRNYLPLSPEILLERLQERKLTTSFFTPAYLEYRLHSRWLNWFNSTLGDFSQTRRNLDLTPAGLLYSLAYWNSLFSPQWQVLFRAIDRLNFKWLIALVFLAGLVLFGAQRIIPKLRKTSIAWAIFTTGFVGMSFDLVFIFSYQSFYGFVFHHIALLVTAFMTGLTCGGWIMTRRLKRITKDILSFSQIELGIIVLALAVGPLLGMINRFGERNLAFVFFLLSFISGFLVGSEFPLANKIYLKDNLTQTAGTLYALDLGGAWFACLFISTALVPVLGILKTCMVLVCLKILSLAAVVFIKERQ